MEGMGEEQEPGDLPSSPLTAALTSLPSLLAVVCETLLLSIVLFRLWAP